jgi:triosephosphate isomerase
MPTLWHSVLPSFRPYHISIRANPGGHVSEPLIGGNWKMYKDSAGTASFFESFLPLVERSGDCDIVIFPSFLDAETAVTATRGTAVCIGAQNLYWETEGAFTGEVSGPMIMASGCSHVLVGHSERRRDFGETNDDVLKKMVAALDTGLSPIVCVGEREKKNVNAVITEQFRSAIGVRSETQFASIVMAYEPVWAIGAASLDPASFATLVNLDWDKERRGCLITRYPECG